MKKPDILLLHGAIATRDQFEPLIAILEKDFTCHTLNFSGHGQEVIHKPFSIIQFAQDVLDWMKSNDFKKIDVFGYSMGGYVALYLAYHYPDFIGKISTLATKLDWNPANVGKETALLVPEKIEAKVPDFARMLDTMHHDWKSVLTHTTSMMLEIAKRPPIGKNQLKKIKHDVLMLVGDQDMTAYSEPAKNACKLLSKGKYTVLANTPHPLDKVNLKVLTSHIYRFFKPK